MNKTTSTLLEFDKIKDLVAHYAISEQGKKLVDKLTPAISLGTITGMLRETTEAVQLLGKAAGLPIHSLSGVENVLSKLGKGGALNPEDLIIIQGLLHECKRMRRYMKEREELAPTVSAYALSLAELNDLRAEIEEAIVNNKVADRYSRELAKARKRINITEDRIKTRLDSYLRSSETRKYLQESLISVRDGRYVIPVKAEYKNCIRGSVLDCSASGSTVFIEPDEIRGLQSDLAVARAQEEKEVHRILCYLTGLVESYQREININIEVMAQYDLAFAKAKFSCATGSTDVHLNTERRIAISGAKHPLLGSHAIPLDFAIGSGYQSLIITGPNTGGKTVVLKTIGLLTMMVQAGLHVPVNQGSEFAIFEKILCDIGDGQDIQQSLSTFSAHIRNITGIVEYANANTLVLLDELGAGTDPSEGTGLAIAILEALHVKGATILATTHYNELKEFAIRNSGFEIGAMAFDLASLKPLYKLQIGSCGESNALSIAFRLGLDRAVVERAHQLTYKERKEYQLENYDQQVMHLVNPEIQEEHLKQIERSREQKNDQKKAKQIAQQGQYSLGDCVLIKSLAKTGIVCELENRLGKIGVLFQGKRLVVNNNQITMHIPATELYPEDYDLDIVLESKEARKKRHIMGKKHVEGLTLEYRKDGPT